MTKTEFHEYFNGAITDRGFTDAEVIELVPELVGDLANWKSGRTAPAQRLRWRIINRLRSDAIESES